MAGVKLQNSGHKSNKDMNRDDESDKRSKEIRAAQLTKLIDSFHLCNKLIENLINDELLDVIEEFEKKPKTDRFISVYDCTLYAGTCVYLSCSSFYPEEIAKAIEITRECAEYCNQRRRKWSLAATFAHVLRIKPDYNSYTEEEAHAELCYAAIMAMRGVLNFIRDNNFLTLITGSLRFKAAHESIGLCQKLMKHRKFEDDELEAAFTQGTKLGLGIANLLLANIPKRLLNILQFIGYGGDRETGLKSLMEGCSDNKRMTIAGMACFGALLVYYLLLRYVLGNGTSVKEFQDLEPLIILYTSQYPNSSGGAYVMGRYENLKGNSEVAMEWLQKSIDKKSDRMTMQMAAICEMAVCHVMRGEFRQASLMVQRLRIEVNVSKCIFTYLEAVYLLAVDDITEDERSYAIKLLQETPDLMVEFGGQHVPFEKFVSTKAGQFIAQDNFLLFPEYEFLYLANFFLLIKFQPDKLHTIIDKIDIKLKALEHRTDWQFYPDNYCLGMLLKGVCLKYLKETDKAKQCFQEVINKENEIFSDVHVAMGARLEMGYLEKKAGNLEEALKHLKLSKKKRFFWLEFRIHQAKYEVKQLIKAQKNSQIKVYYTGH